MNSKALRLSMQYFADETPPAEPDQSGQPAIDYAELAKTDAALQGYLEQATKSAVATAVQAALDKERLLADEKVSEAEKLAKMTKDEKQAYEFKQLQAKLANYEAEKSRDALKAEALKIASEQAVPAVLIELLPFEKLKAEEVKTSVEAVKAVFDKAVADGVAGALDNAGKPTGKAEHKPTTQDASMRAVMGLK